MNKTKGKSNEKIINTVEKYSIFLNTEDLKNNLIKLQTCEVEQSFIYDLNKRYKIDEIAENRIIRAYLETPQNGIKEMLSIINISIEDAQKYISILGKTILNYKTDDLNAEFIQLFFCNSNYIWELIISEVDDTDVRTITIPLSVGDIWKEDSKRYCDYWKNLYYYEYPIFINCCCNYLRTIFVTEYNYTYAPELQKLIDRYFEIIKSPAFPALTKELKARETQLINEKIEKEKKHNRELLRLKQLKEQELAEEKRRKEEELCLKKKRKKDSVKKKQRLKEEEIERNRENEQQETEEEESKQEEQQQYKENIIIGTT